ncbi:MAG: hypothetical protein EOP84_00595 [Verrucomicrobiaceae bacterium]|nr:MAG: hypothetical protein EOP84_00595 [Verrucomicrobiaceae bacterium]
MLATLKDTLEMVSYACAPVLVIIAGIALWQLKLAADQVKVGANQIKAAKDIAGITAQREALRIAAEQTASFGDTFVPLWKDFTRLKSNGAYPILSAAKVVEAWPDIQCQVDDFPGMMAEIYSNDALAVRIANRMEGFAMYFACGVADADKAYRPVASVFCDACKALIPYLTFANQRENQFTYTLSVYATWGSRKFAEATEKEIEEKKKQISKIQVQPSRPFGASGDC